jgi:hypothetical protein
MRLFIFNDLLLCPALLVEHTIENTHNDVVIEVQSFLILGL